MRHLYRCPLRWADLDMLGHINNVIYVDYLQEARIDMLATHAPDTRSQELAEGVVVVDHEVTYLSPLGFRHEPVQIESWVTEIKAATFTMGYEIFDDLPDGTRRVYLRATTKLTPYVFSEERPRRVRPEEREALQQFLEPSERAPRKPYPKEVPADKVHVYDLFPRFSDVDIYGHVNNVKYFEYFQEARIAVISALAAGIPEGTEPISQVVAQTEVEYLAPVVFRLTPYPMRIWVERVGTSSFTIAGEIRDGDRVLARHRVVMVTFDPATQRSTPAPEAYRELLGSLLVEG